MSNVTASLTAIALVFLTLFTRRFLVIHEGEWPTRPRLRRIFRAVAGVSFLVLFTLVALVWHTVCQF